MVQLIELDGEALPDRTDTRIADQRHVPLPMSHVVRVLEDDQALCGSAETLLDQLRRAFGLVRSGEAYVNVHTEDNPPGEIRGISTDPSGEQCR